MLTQGGRRGDRAVCTYVRTMSRHQTTTLLFCDARLMTIFRLPVPLPAPVLPHHPLLTHACAALQVKLQHVSLRTEGLQGDKFSTLMVGQKASGMVQESLVVAA